MLKTLGFWAALMLPLWDIPLIVRVVQRKSSEDISLVWAAGIWATSVMMAPSSFLTKNPIAIAFNVANVTMLSLVLIVTLKYRKKVI